MTIVYCKEHRAEESAEEGICELAARIMLVPGPYPKPDYPTPCRMVEKRLVSVDALVIEKDKLRQAIFDAVMNVQHHDERDDDCQMEVTEIVDRVLDALASERHGDSWGGGN